MSPNVDPPADRVVSPKRCRVEMMRLGWRETDAGDWTHEDARRPIPGGVVERRPALALAEAGRRSGVSGT